MRRPGVPVIWVVALTAVMAVACSGQNDDDAVLEPSEEDRQQHRDELESYRDYLAGNEEER